MSYDIKITGGRLVDGTGQPAFDADIGIRDGQIVEIGRLSGPAKREIEVDGALVTPGFVDAHTHYDGQAMWDSTLESSTRHGVTTAVMGNCGVGFAPLRPGDQDRLINLMSGVEDIPGTVLSNGLAWNWVTFGDYLDRMAEVPRSIDVATQVPHDPVRLFVMGDRAARREAATAEDVDAMRRIVREALSAGAFGFTTGRIDLHRARDGSPTPASIAAHSELVAIASVLKELPHRVIQLVSDWRQAHGPEAFDDEFDLVDAMLDAAERPISFSVSERYGAVDQWQRVLARGELSIARGRTVRFQVAPRGVGMFFGLTATANLFMMHPSYRAIAHLPLAERLVRMRDPGFRARILTEVPAISDDHPNTLVPEMIADFDQHASKMYRMGRVPNYEPGPQDSLLGEARANGRTALEQAYEAHLMDEGRELVMLPFINYNCGNLDAVHSILSNPHAFPALGDAGAHVGATCDTSYSTFALRYWSQDRRSGPRIPLEQIVHKMTAVTAAHFGLQDRGCLRPGLRADINVIDFENLRLERPYPVDDLPAGGRRFMQDAHGYLATLVAGVPVAEHDRQTGARPGRLLRAPT